MKNILFPTDFSENAKNAIYYGMSLFEGEHCKFILLNIFSIPFANPEVPVSMNDVTSQNADKLFEILIKQIKKDFPENTFEIETKFRIGEISPTVSNLIKKNEIDLVIMGTQGASGFEAATLGTRTARLIRNIMSPVLVIPDGIRFKDPERILLALDNEITISKKILKPLLEIAFKYNSDFLILHVITNNNEENLNIKNKVDDYFKNVNHSYHEVHDKNVSNGIDQFIKKKNPSMLGMVNHNLNFFKEIFHKSITKEMALHTNIPLLAMHDKK
jgi:nucleotide-binding universal stress UspA family protein